jgi:hypothetical protein
MSKVRRPDLLLIQMAAVSLGSSVICWGVRNDEPFVTAVGGFACTLGIGAILLNLEMS